MNVSILESSYKRDFTKLLLEAVDETLSSLGSSSKRAIYFYLERNFSIKKQEIPNRIEEFTDAIEKLFGNGAKILEIQIMKHLHENLGRDFEYFSESDNLLFTDYANVVRTHVDKPTRAQIDTRRLKVLDDTLSKN